uniref:RING-type domain-containing protein n=1 Tax=Glycine max TaxID=3847 RepID=A0A0R0I3Z8_SOYBN
MASSQIEIASSSPFGCALRDRNHREACSRESGNVKSTHHHHHANFQRNMKNFVMDLNMCMAVSSDSKANENENNSSSSSSINNHRKAPKNKQLERLLITRANPFINNSNVASNETSLASLISPRHSGLLDRWATRQACQMVSNLENEAELLSMDGNDMLPRTSSSSEEESSFSSETRNGGGASSLVQIWEKRLNQSSVSKPNTPRERIGSTSSSINENANAFSPENVNAFSGEEQCFDGPSGNEESFTSSSFPDWESSDQSLSPSRRSESDRVRVADIIKKLTSTSQNQCPTPSFADDNEHEGYGSSVTGSPCRERECDQQHSEQNRRVNCSLRIRGRRAYIDLLAQMENDRLGELNNLVERGAVSKFPQRGRIQAMLRLRLLQRGVAANDQPRQKSTASEVNNSQPHGYAIMQLSSGAELRTPVQTELANPRSPQRETVNKTTQLDNSVTTDQLSKDTSNKKGHGNANHATESTQKSASQTRIDHSTEEAHPSSDIKAPQNDSRETTEATTSTIDSNLNEMTADREETSNQQNAMAKSSNDETVNEEEESNQQHAETSYEETIEEASNQNYAESSYDDEMEEEVEEIDQNCYETNYDWISEISRPRSYWEECRQAWYREMLETGTQNEDIRRLLERRTVSSFLSSDFRGRMDRLMESHRGTQTHLVNSQDREEDSQGLMAFLQERLHSTRASQDGSNAREEEDESRNQDEEEEDNTDEQEQEHEEEHEKESLISGSYHEVGDYSNQSSSWSYRDNEAGDDFDRVVSSSPQPYQSQSFYSECRHSSSTNHHSIEMELIYDLRGHMEQLYSEISELRKSIKGCLEMQMELQQSIKQEVQTASVMQCKHTITVKKEEKKSNDTTLKKGNCCICYEMKVDSVLYRCGHMCTCLKCANELQWNSGKCPICRAKIVDVVHVYVDS